MVELLLAMVWVLSGLFVVFLMQIADQSKSENYNGAFWLKNRDDRFLRIIVSVIAAPISLLFGIVAVYDCDDKE